MLRSYITLALRQLWRNRLYTGLNVLGLAIGLSACWVIFQIVSYEFSFDRNLPNRDRLYRVVSNITHEGEEAHNPGTPKPLAQAMQTQLTGVERVAPVQKHWSLPVDIEPTLATGKPRRISEAKAIWRVTPDYFQLVPYRWLVGNPLTALAEPGKVVLSASRAQQYFPHLTTEQVLGQRLTYYGFNDTIRTEVAGVVADLTYPTDFNAKEFVALAGDTTYQSNPVQWSNTSSSDQLYVLLRAGADPRRLEQEATTLSARNAESVMKKFKLTNHKRAHVLQPLADIHVNRDYGARTDYQRLYGLIGLALFVLTLACVNYINLSTAQVPQRAREIGVRKTLGSSRRTLMTQFLGETALVTLLALLLAWPLSGLFMQSFQEFIPDGTTDYLNWPRLLLFLAVLVIGVSALAGAYPAWLSTRLQAIQVLRGNGKLLLPAGPAGRITLRKGLIVFQFIVAQVFIVGAVIIGRQLHFAYTRDMGFQIQAIVQVKAPFRWVWNEKSPMHTRHLLMRDAFRRVPGIAAVSLGDAPFVNSTSSNEARSRGRKGQEIAMSIQKKTVDTAWLNLYDVKLLAGRNLIPSDTAREYVINETAVKMFDLGTPQQAIGSVLTVYDIRFPVVGVVKDFNTLGITQKITPVALLMNTPSATVNVKMASANPADWAATLTKMEAIWKKMYPDDPFNYRFFDETLNDIYQEERTLSRIVNLATGVAILISCLGLFGLATLTAFQRTKEIGIRKVLGASVASVVGLLSREFVGLVGIAVLIATPLAGWGMHRWLGNFAYKIDLSWWLFAGAATLALFIALATVAFQSIRAAVANPVESLRSE